MLSLTDILQNKEKCNKVTFSSEYRGDFRVGDCVSLPCEEAWKDRDYGCYDIIWLFSKDNREPVTELVVEGKVKSDDNRSRLRVTEDCSLEVKTLRKEDEGLYNCRQYPPAHHHHSKIMHGILWDLSVSISILIYLPKCTLLCWNQSMRMRIWPVTCFKYSYLNIVSCVLWWRF